MEAKARRAGSAWRPTDSLRAVNRRPKLAIVAPAASPAEAAAVVAALERFMRDTPAPPAPAVEPRGRWLRTARLEAVRMGGGGAAPWGDRDRWG